MSIIVPCIALTKKGVQCKNYSLNKKPFCKIHFKSVEELNKQSETKELNEESVTKELNKQSKTKELNEKCLTKELNTKKQNRKNCDYNGMEYVIALLIIYPNINNDKDLMEYVNENKIMINNKEQYITDILTKKNY